MINDRPNDFSSRNLFLQTLLGLHSISDQITATLHHASESPAEPEDPVVLALLGLLGVDRTIQQAFFKDTTPPAKPAPSKVPLSDLLR